jgi:hypothetical protein
MNRVVLHLLGSLLLGITLLGVAEAVGRSEARAYSTGSASVRPVKKALPSEARTTLIERCWELAGLELNRSTPAPVRTPEPTGRPLPYGWGYLPPLWTAG